MKWQTISQLSGFDERRLPDAWSWSGGVLSDPGLSLQWPTHAAGQMLMLMIQWLKVMQISRFNIFWTRTIFLLQVQETTCHPWQVFEADWNYR